MFIHNWKHYILAQTSGRFELGTIKTTVQVVYHLVCYALSILLIRHLGLTFCTRREEARTEHPWPCNVSCKFAFRPCNTHKRKKKNNYTLLNFEHINKRSPAAYLTTGHNGWLVWYWRDSWHGRGLLFISVEPWKERISRSRQEELGWAHISKNNNFMYF